MATKLNIDTLIKIDSSGMPKPLELRQYLDKDIRQLYIRDKTEDKSIFLKELIVIYYLGDPNSPARQAGLNDNESLAMAIEQADLKPTYIPDELVIRLYQRYYNQNITEAGRTVENLIKSIHVQNIMVSKITDLLNEKSANTMQLEDIPTIVSASEAIMKIAKDIPTVLKKLEEAKEQLLYEQEVESARGGDTITSSMNAEDYL